MQTNKHGGWCGELQQFFAGFSFYNSGAKASKLQSVAVGSASAYVGPVSPVELEQASHLIFQVNHSFLCTLSQLCCDGMHERTVSGNFASPDTC